MASTTATTTATKAATDIDDLLATYLELLDTYTTLRSKLTALQSSTSLSLARATFSTPNRLGYTPQSNTSLRASARLRVSPPDASAPLTGEDAEEGAGKVFELLPVEPAEVPKSDTEGEGQEDGAADEDEDGSVDADSTPDSEPTKSLSAPAPPLPPGFGALPPPSLREAQASAIEAIHIIAQLAGVEVKMRAVEVEVRRGRKRAAKVKAAEEKEEKEGR